MTVLTTGAIKGRVESMGARPPGSLHGAALAETCTGCGDCVAVCPTGLVWLDAEYLPRVGAMSECVQCGLCADVCMQGAIELTPQTVRGLRAVKQMEQRLAWHGFNPDSLA